MVVLYLPIRIDETASQDARDADDLSIIIHSRRRRRHLKSKISIGI